MGLPASCASRLQATRPRRLWRQLPAHALQCSGTSDGMVVSQFSRGWRERCLPGWAAGRQQGPSHQACRQHVRTWDVVGRLWTSQSPSMALIHPGAEPQSCMYGRALRRGAFLTALSTSAAVCDVHVLVMTPSQTFVVCCTWIRILCQHRRDASVSGVLVSQMFVYTCAHSRRLLPMQTYLL